MAICKLSALAVSKMSKPGCIGDGGGLWVRLTKAGSKSWVFRYTIRGKQREMGLGPTHTIDLATAREKAKECRAMLLTGKDPIDTRNAERLQITLSSAKAMTFDECAQAYIKAHKASWKNAKHLEQWERTIASYANPIIGNLPVAEVDTALVVKVLSAIWDTKTETATRLRGRIESILDWATVSNYRQGDNPARWRGHLDNLLANPRKIAPVKNRPALPWQEIGEFMADLRKREGVATKAIEFVILTAARSGEVRGARWSEIDLDAKTWTVPAERMKAGVEHRVPLSSAAIALLDAMPRLGDLVFPGQSQDAMLSDMSLMAALRRMERHEITVHGFRSTFRDWCAESISNSFPREVCEHALAHKLPDKVEAAYQRGDLLAKRTMLMQAWADYCAMIPKKADVAPIRGMVA